jgi:FMN-dependent NADH-azoreductase
LIVQRRRADSSAKHAETYLRTVLSFLGVRNPELIVPKAQWLANRIR